MQYQALPVIDDSAGPRRTMHARCVHLSAKRGEATGQYPRGRQAFPSQRDASLTRNYGTRNQLLPSRPFQIDTASTQTRLTISLQAASP